MTNWQPIETAPKDGTHVLINIAFPASLRMERDAVVPTYWQDPKKLGLHGNCYHGWTGKMSSGYASLWEIEGIGGVATHWAPMPKLGEPK